jgi:hypothetical protein
MSDTVGVYVLFESRIIVTKPADFEGRSNSVTCVRRQVIQNPHEYLNDLMKLHLLIQGSAVHKSINNAIQHHSILGLNHAFTHSPQIQGPVIYAGGNSAMAPPLRDFTAHI